MFDNMEPILLVHGCNMRDTGLVPYWGRIPKMLRQQGLTVYLSHTDAWNTIEKNGAVIQKRVHAILQKENCQRIHLIAHSKGGLESRYAISRLGLANCITSLTTISTPHYGCLAADHYDQWPRWIRAVISRGMNAAARLAGDAKPDFYHAFYQLTTQSMQLFNQRIPDMPGIYYQSYASAMSSPRSDMLMALSNWIIQKLEGENDGLVAVSSMNWGTTHPILRAEGVRGISHQDIIDLRQKKAGNFDVLAFYIEIVKGISYR